MFLYTSAPYFGPQNYCSDSVLVTHDIWSCLKVSFITNPPLAGSYEQVSAANSEAFCFGSKGLFHSVPVSWALPRCFLIFWNENKGELEWIFCITIKWTIYQRQAWNWSLELIHRKAVIARSLTFDQIQIEGQPWWQNGPILCALQLCCWVEDLKTNILGSRPVFMKM